MQIHLLCFAKPPTEHKPPMGTLVHWYSCRACGCRCQPATARSTACFAVMAADDVRAQDIKEDECDGEYVVDKIFDEWKVGGITYYLVK